MISAKEKLNLWIHCQHKIYQTLLGLKTCQDSSVVSVHHIKTNPETDSLIKEYANILKYANNNQLYILVSRPRIQIYNLFKKTTIIQQKECSKTIAPN